VARSGGPHLRLSLAAYSFRRYPDLKLKPKPAMTLGEISLLDGVPRFATCLAIEPTTIAVLTRDDMLRIIRDEPRLGAKILVNLVTLLSQRLRRTSAKLLDLLPRGGAA